MPPQAVWVELKVSITGCVEKLFGFGWKTVLLSTFEYHAREQMVNRKTNICYFFGCGARCQKHFSKSVFVVPELLSD